MNKQPENTLIEGIDKQSNLAHSKHYIFLFNVNQMIGSSSSQNDNLSKLKVAKIW